MSDERRVVTVLFADVSGSTALGETLDPEDLRALLSRYYAIAKDVIAAHGGTVEKFIGDAVMAVFGLRRAHGDDAVRALSAAMELRDRVRSEPRLGERMPIRLGVNTGDVVASRDPGSEDFLVTGDAVNVAARIQQTAAPWSIVAGQRTVRAARSEFRFGAPQPVNAKGKSEPLTVSELLGRAHSVTGRTPIFGRDADLGQMDLVAKRAFGEGRPFLVSVIAPAGTGKTRLLEEFLDRLRRSVPDARVAVAQCLPYGQRLTYWPLRAVLFRIVGLDEDAPADEICAGVEQWLVKAGVDDASSVGQLLASTIGEADAEINDRNALFAAWRAFIEAASRQEPLVVAIEDLHWSSDTLLDLFEFVLQPRRDTRALLIALARPELLDRRPNWGGGRRNYVSIALEPLDDSAAAQLVRTLAEGASDDLVDAIVARAEGNPFFAGEIVGAVLERVKSFDDPAQVQAALGRLPDTVQATVLARLDELPDDEREVLRVGSVFGRSFRPQGVAALIGRDGVSGDSMVQISERLADRDLIRPTGADGFTFRHILIREVAYSTLPRATRAQLHGAAGRWLEERAAGREEALAELVAYHYREAASLATAMELDDAAELRDKARTWLVRAGEVAMAAVATIEARDHVAAAIEFARPEDLPELYELYGDVEVGGNPTIAQYDKALDLGRRAGRGPDFELRVIAKELMVEMRAQGTVSAGRSDEGIGELRSRGRELLEVTTDKGDQAGFLAADAFYPFWLRATGRRPSNDDQANAELSARRAVALATEVDNSNVLSAALDALGALAQERGGWEEAIVLGQQRIGMGSRLGLIEQLDAYAVTTWAALVLARLEQADQISAAGMAIVQPGQTPDWTLHLVAWRALALLWLGKWKETLAVMDHGHHLWLQAGRPAAGYATRGFMAGLFAARQMRDESRTQRFRAVVDEITMQFANSIRFQMVRSVARSEWKSVAAAIGGGGGLQSFVSLEGNALALASCNDVLQPIDPGALTDGLQRARDLNSRLVEAEVQRAIGLGQGSRDALVAAQEIYQQARAVPFEARARCELALIDDDRAALDAGLATLESLGDVVQVERYLKRSSKR
jgi:class 3 adenylate cyclase